MKAMMLTGLNRMELQDVADPRIRAGTDVLLRLAVVGVCGSDVHYYTEGRIGSQVVEYPFAVGHECSAVVEKIGRRVTRVKVGDRVTVDPAVSCGACDQCRCGRANTCRNMRFLGCPGQAPGCLSEFIVMPETCCYKIRRSTTLEQAALVEPLSIGYYSVERSIPMPGARIGILGCGPIGLSVMLAARSKGVDRIYATDRIDARLVVARRAGARWTGNPDSTDVVADVARREPLLLDAVFECCGQQAAVDQALEMLKPGGTFVFVGIPSVDRISFDMDHMRRREIRVQNIRRQNECLQPALNLIQNGKTPADFMITHRFSFEQCSEAFDLVANYRDGVLKAMVHVLPV
jgi:L-iditol 2-dehydrogenase